MNKKNKTKKNFIKTYNKEDYHSNDGMLTTVWGPPLWHFLHTMSFNYPINPTEENKKYYKNFILNLRYILPCIYCRKNLINNLKKKPLLMSYMKNRDTFSRYIYELHELVNKMLKKTSNLTYDEVRERYEHFRSRCTEEKPTIFKFKTDTFKKTKKNKKEKGCIIPLYGKKSKCILNIVPQEDKKETFNMDKRCIKHKFIVGDQKTNSSIYNSE